MKYVVTIERDVVLDEPAASAGARLEREDVVRTALQISLAIEGFAQILKRQFEEEGVRTFLYMAEDAGAADLIAGSRLQLGISRGSPEQVIDGFRYFGYQPAADDAVGADMARQHTDAFLKVITGVGFAQPSPNPMFPNPPGLLRPEPHSPGLRDRIWWGAGSRPTAQWAAQQGLNLMSSTARCSLGRNCVPSWDTSGRGMRPLEANLPWPP
jgi:hypothetical protein